jgi:hypothetical protein
MEWVSGNIFIRPNRLPVVGDAVDGHKHNFDHTTIVFTGAVHVTATLPDGRVIERDFKAPAHFLVRADVTHRIEATEPETVFWCVYAHRTPQGDIVQDYTGWPEAYR